MELWPQQRSGSGRALLPGNYGPGTISAEPNEIVEAGQTAGRGAGACQNVPVIGRSELVAARFTSARHCRFGTIARITLQKRLGFRAPDSGPVRAARKKCFPGVESKEPDHTSSSLDSLGRVLGTDAVFAVCGAPAVTACFHCPCRLQPIHLRHCAAPFGGAPR